MRPLKRGALLAVGAIAAGGVGIWFGDRHLEQRAIEVEKALREDHATRQVIVASGDLAAGDRLAEDNVALREVPATYVHEDAVPGNGWGRLAGGRLRTDIAAGKAILESHIREDVETRLAERLSPGDRAITIPVSGGGDIAGLLNPGDRLDLMLTYRDSGERQTVPLLDDVPILATGMQFTRVGKTGARMGYDDLTVAVSPVEAARITHALAIGEIRVVLRADTDDAPIKGYRIDAEVLMSDNTRTEDVHDRPPVQLIIGGRR